MADVLKFDAVSREQVRARKTSREEEFSFWPEVSSGFWVVSNDQPVDPANSARRVLTEFALILGGCGLLVVLTTLLAHGM